MNCTHCGTSLPVGAKFCSHCAHAVDMSTVPQAVTAIQVPPKPQFVPASVWSRLFNHILDSIFFYVLVYIIILLLSPMLTGAGNSEMWERNGVLLGILMIIGPYILWIAYFLVFELVLQVTPGKFITRTKVVMRDGSKPPFLNILGRSFSRIIPFEPFSFLFSMNPAGWHDTLSKTLVVSKKYSAEDVQKIDPLTAKGGEKNVALMVVIIIVGMLVLIAIIGILSSVVLVSLNSARNKGKEMQVRSALMTIRPAMEVYYANHGNTYSVADACYKGAFLDKDVAPVLSSLNAYNPQCAASGSAYAVSAQLASSKDTFCIDSTAFADVGSIDITGGPHCVSGSIKMISTGTPGTWSTFESARDRFSISLPSEPRYTSDTRTKSGATIITNKYEARTADDSYMVVLNTMSFTVDASEFQSLLSGTLEGMVSSSPGNVLISSSDSIFQGHAAKDFSLSNSGELLTGKLVVLAPDKTLMLIADTSVKEFDKGQYDSFVNSFKMKP